MQIGDPCKTAAGQEGRLEPWFDQYGELKPYPICSSSGPVYDRAPGTRVTTTIGPPVPPANAPRGPNRLAREADAILAALPGGSGVNPFSSGAATFPHEPAFVSVRDGFFGGTRNVPYYEAHPVADASGLILWTGPDSGRFADNLSQAQNLAAAVLLAGGDRSSFADYSSTDPNSYGGSYAAYVGPTYEEFREPLPASAPAGYEVYNPPAPDAEPIEAAPMDETQPVVLVDDDGGEIATVFPPSAIPITRGGGDGVVFDVPANVDPQTAIDKVTDFLSGIANAAGQVGDTAERVKRAVQGAAAGAQAGYNAPLNLKPWLIGAGVVALVAARSSSRRKR